mmetsp:Transcript_8178/g.26939  ORF Transcript_8178/g.26939 Transcript_8178/m.26939 type:complete len:327 (+) Transcript_8178:1660-2640(+)
MAFRMVVTNGRDASFNSVGSIIFPEYASPPIPLSATKQVSLLSSTLFPVRVINFSALKGTSLRKSSTVMFFSTLEIFGVTYRKGNSSTVIVASPLLSDVAVVSPLLLAILLSITRKAQSKTILSPSEKYSASSLTLRTSSSHAFRISSLLVSLSSSSSSSSLSNRDTNRDAVALSASIPSDALFFLFVVFVPSKLAPFINRTMPPIRSLFFVFVFFSYEPLEEHIIFANRFSPFTDALLFFCRCTSWKWKCNVSSPSSSKLSHAARSISSTVFASWINAPTVVVTGVRVVFSFFKVAVVCIVLSFFFIVGEDFRRQKGCRVEFLVV